MANNDAHIVYLVNKVKTGDEDAFAQIEQAFTPFVERLARTHYIKGADTDDVKQIVRFGLWKACMDFDDSKGTTFFSFASLCCRRSIITTISTALAKKHDVLNNAISLNQTINNHNDDGEGEQSLGAYIADPQDDILTCIIKQESNEQALIDLHSSLTSLERLVLTHYMESDSYEEIANSLQESDQTDANVSTTKMVDNALTRIRKKAKTIAPSWL